MNTIKISADWEQMLESSTLNAKAVTRVTARFEKLKNILQDRHDKIISKNAKIIQFPSNESVGIDFEDTSNAIDQIENGKQKQ